MSQNGF